MILNGHTKPPEALCLKGFWTITEEYLQARVATTYWHIDLFLHGFINVSLNLLPLILLSSHLRKLAFEPG